MPTAPVTHAFNCADVFTAVVGGSFIVAFVVFAVIVAVKLCKK